MIEAKITARNGLVQLFNTLFRQFNPLLPLPMRFTDPNTGHMTPIMMLQYKDTMVVNIDGGPAMTITRRFSCIDVEFTKGGALTLSARLSKN